MNRYAVNDLDELPGYFVFLPAAISPARSPASRPASAGHPGAGVGTRGWLLTAGGGGQGRQSISKEPATSAPVERTWAGGICA